MVRTIVIGADVRAAGREPLAERAMRLGDERLRKVFAGDAGLVRHYDNYEARAVERADRVGRPRKQRHPLDRSQIADIFDDRAVAVEEYGRARRRGERGHKLRRAASRTVATRTPR